MSRPHRELHSLEKQLASWRWNRAQDRVSEAAEERLWQRVVESARAIVADAFVPCGALCHLKWSRCDLPKGHEGRHHTPATHETVEYYWHDVR